MNDGTVTVVAFMRARAGKVDALRRELLALLAPTRAEDGCLNYDLHVSRDEPGTFMFHENWTSKAHLDRHLESPHLNALKAKLDDLVAEPPEILLYNRIG